MSKAGFLDGVRASRAELLDAIARVDRRTLAEAKMPGLDWTAKDMLCHLIGYDHAILNATKDIRAGRPFTWGWTFPNFDPWNESNVAPRRSRPLVAVLAELETTRTALLRELEGWPDDGGPFGVDSWDEQKSEINWLASHEREHAEMIAKLGATPAR